MKLIRSKEWYEKRIAKEGDSEIGAGTLQSLPNTIIRMDDGVLFLLNKETNKYRAHLGIPHLDDPKHLHNEYTYERLMIDPRNKGLFKVADGTEDLEAIRRAYQKSFLKSHRYCGNDDDEDCGKGRE